MATPTSWPWRSTFTLAQKKQGNGKALTVDASTLRRVELNFAHPTPSLLNNQVLRVKHFAHYIKRTVVTAGGSSPVRGLPFAELQSEDQGFSSPIYHSVPLNSGVASRVRVGDTIWLFSQLGSPWGSLPPALDGKIEVGEVAKSQGKAGRYRFGASGNSKWYPLFSAIELAGELNAIDAQGHSRHLLNTPRTAIGQALQFLREIADPAPLFKHAARVEEMAPDFISYRMVDGTRMAFELATRLLDNQRAVFWDRWSLPRRLAERDEHVAAMALDAHITATIEHARIVWGVHSERYALAGTYSKLEKDWAERLGKFRAYPPLAED
ncbi:hypothetical protein [Pseudomonas veronii]|uniref:hypothetical protein n=1 Tax=Pseudomonas veronii TaxID=76761 RepID=UPI00126031FC|nr:hypothetical protein [Pseudomonas veronii]